MIILFNYFILFIFNILFKNSRDWPVKLSFSRIEKKIAGSQQSLVKRSMRYCEAVCTYKYCTVPSRFGPSPEMPSPNARCVNRITQVVMKQQENSHRSSRFPEDSLSNYPTAYSEKVQNFVIQGYNSEWNDAPSRRYIKFCSFGSRFVWDSATMLLRIVQCNVARRQQCWTYINLWYEHWYYL